MKTNKDKQPDDASTLTDDHTLLDALSELGRSINTVITYGKNHPAATHAIEATIEALRLLFEQRKQIVIGSFNGALTVNAETIKTNGTLLKSLERRLARLRITGLRINTGITEAELAQLVELLSSNETEDFQSEIGKAGLEHIAPEEMHLQAVGEGQTVANESDLASNGGDGVLVLEDDKMETMEPSPDVHVSQIVAFLKGDSNTENPEIEEELAELASDPERLGKMIMESVAIRQSMTDFSGESLGDIILGCLRRTYSSLRKQPEFRTSNGMADLKKSLLLLEKSLLERMHLLSGDPDPELDRKLVQKMREMDSSLDFEMAALQYMEKREAIETEKRKLQDFIQTHGADVAGELLSDTGFPTSDWRKIVIESGRPSGGSAENSIATGLEALTSLFERLEQAMSSEQGDDDQVKDLLGQATESLDDSTCSAKEKLDSLSRQLKEEDTGTIGGQALAMSRKEILSSISEIAQELMQPLTATNASIEMMLQGYTGDISNEQHDMLKLASNSGEHLKYLINELIDIVGCPANKGIDSRFHTTSEEVVRMNKGN